MPKKVRRSSLDLSDDRQTLSISVFNPPEDDAEDGAPQTVFEKVGVAFDAINPALVSTFALLGLAEAFRNRTNGLDAPLGADLRKQLDDLLAEVKSGDFKPGRSLAEREPTDIELALAEATGQPIHLIQKDVEERLVRDAEGNPKRDARNRTQRVFTKRALDALASDPRIKPIMARLARERADRLARDMRGKKADDSTSKLGAMFEIVPQATAEAAQ